MTRRRTDSLSAVTGSIIKEQRRLTHMYCGKPDYSPGRNIKETDRLRRIFLRFRLKTVYAAAFAFTCHGILTSAATGNDALSVGTLRTTSLHCNPGGSKFLKTRAT